MSDAVKIQGLKKTYANGTTALEGLDLQIKKGDFFALLGANGAGKTTTIGIMTSLVNKNAGLVEVFGHDIDQDPNAVKLHVGVVPQEFNFSIFEKVIDIVSWQAGYFGVPRKEAVKRSEKLLKDLGLWEKRNVPSRQLSGGMKRRLMIARALVHKPKLLILDEPTAGVDVELRHGMWEYLKDLNAKGTTILLTTHYLEEVEQLCKNMAMIKDGKVVAQGAVKQLLGRLEQETYLVNVNNVEGYTKVKGFKMKKVDTTTLEVDIETDRAISELVMALDAAGLQVQDLRPKGNRMEQLFLNLLKG